MANLTEVDVTTVASGTVDKKLDLPPIEVGADYAVPIFLKTGTPTDTTPLESLPPMDLRGYEAFMQVRETLEATTLLLNLRSYGNSGMSIEGATGCIWIRLPASKTKTIRWKTGVYDIFLKAPVAENSMSDGIIKLRTGTITAAPSVTKL